VAVTAAALLTGCSNSTVSVRPPSPSGAVAEQCAHLGNVLPARLESLGPRVISPRSPLVHAWGTPAVVLTCGVARPAGYSPSSSETTAVDGVEWFEQPHADSVTWTAVRSNPDAQPVYLALQVPTHYQGQGAFLVDLARPLRLALP
jgi:Protein of unknown function (DUF3515)